jgi:hypothetical protein
MTHLAVLSHFSDACHRVLVQNLAKHIWKRLHCNSDRFFVSGYPVMFHGIILLACCTDMNSLLYRYRWSATLNISKVSEGPSKQVATKAFDTLIPSESKKTILLSLHWIGLLQQTVTCWYITLRTNELRSWSHGKGLLDGKQCFRGGVLERSAIDSSLKISFTNRYC